MPAAIVPSGDLVVAPSSVVPPDLLSLRTVDEQVGPVAVTPCNGGLVLHYPGACLSAPGAPAAAPPAVPTTNGAPVVSAPVAPELGADAPVARELTNLAAEALADSLMPKGSKEPSKDLCKANKVACGGKEPDVVARLLKMVGCVGLVMSMGTLSKERSGKFPSPGLYVSNGVLVVCGPPPGQSNSARDSAITFPMETDEYARPFHTIADPTVFSILQLSKRRRTRLELDAGAQETWKEHVAVLYNELDFSPERSAVVPASLEAVIRTKNHSHTKHLSWGGAQTLPPV